MKFLKREKINEFLSSPYKGKVMLCRDHFWPFAELGAGAIVHVSKAHPKLLEKIKGAHQKSPKNVVGDTDGLMVAKGDQGPHVINDQTWDKVRERIASKNRKRFYHLNELRREAEGNEENQ